MTPRNADLSGKDDNLPKAFLLINENPTKSDVATINDAFQNATTIVDKAQNRALWLSSLRTLASACEDDVLPKGILVEPLMEMGVHLVGAAFTHAEVLKQAFNYTVEIDEQELLRHAVAAALEVVSAKGDDEDPWDIAHRIDALFVETIREKDGPRIGVGGYAYMDWLPGVTTYNQSTHLLENFRFILKPHAADTDLTNIPGSDHIIAKRATARVVNGELRDVEVSLLTTERCECA